MYLLYYSNTLFSNIFCLYLCTSCSAFLIIDSRIILEGISSKQVHIDCLNRYSLIFYRFYKPSLLILLIYFIFNYYLLLTLEVSTINLNALSLYFWFGFQVSGKRLEYYFNKKNNIYKSAYNLVHNKFFGKNMKRRYLIFFSLEF